MRITIIVAIIDNTPGAEVVTPSGRRRNINYQRVNKMLSEIEKKDEIIKYVQALETSYTDAIRDLKNIIDKEKR